MECCSPDVGDCKKCHPDLWKQIKKGVWISKEFPLETRPRPNKTIKRSREQKKKGTRRRRNED